jgi:hypothetical protein
METTPSSITNVPCIIESTLIAGALALLDEIEPARLFLRNFRRERKEIMYLGGRVPLATRTDHGVQRSSPLLTAAFILHRLGVVAANSSIPPAKRTLSILSSDHCAVEVQAHQILAATPYTNSRDRVGYRFYEECAFETVSA